ncbi:MAG: PAS domain S-box protein [Myxococcota bacterium]
MIAAAAPVLLVEDSPTDAKLVAYELRRGGLAVEPVRVDAEHTFRAALEEEPGVVLCDWNIPGFDARRALHILRERWPHVPFLVVSGSIGEDAAVELMKHGAADYLQKDRLTRLVPAIQQAMEKRALEISNRDAQRAMKESEERFRAAFEQSTVGLAHCNLEGRIIRSNPKLREILGYPQEGPIELDAFTLPEDQPAMYVRLRNLLSGACSTYTLERQCLRPDGTRVWVTTTATLIRGVDGRPSYIMVSVEDIDARKVAEAAVREGQRRLRIALENGTSVAFVWDVQEDLVTRYHSTEPALPATGDSPEPIAKTAARVHPEDRASFRQVMENAMREGGEFRNLFRVIRPDGTLRWMDGHGVMERDAAGKPIRATGVVIDITELRAGEEAARESEERYRLATLATNDAIWDLDPRTGKVTWNERYDEILQRPKDLGAAANWEWWQDRIHPDDRARVMASIESAIAGTGDRWDAEYRFLRPDGTWGEFQDCGYIARGPDGKPRRLVGAISDETEKRRTQADLMLRDRAIQASTQGLIITDPTVPHNPFIYVSPAFERITGYTAEEALGQTGSFLQGPDSDPAAVQRIREAVRKGEPCRVEIKNYRKDGRSFWSELAIAPVFDEYGKLTNWLGVQTDISDRRALEDQFRHAQKMEAIGRLAGGVAHDFNNLLTVINLCANTLLSELTDELLREDAEQILAAGARAHALTAQLLAFSRKQISQPRVLELDATIGEALRMLRRVVGEDVELIGRLDSRERVFLDPDQLTQVIMNLAVNARDAMPSGGRLELVTERVTLEAPLLVATATLEPGTYARLKVIDSGTGMDEATRVRIFEPFFTTKPAGRGTGLGLATVYGIIQQSGGALDVSSAIGRGTTLSVYLPIHSGPAVRRNTEGDRTLTRGTELVLVVEDEEPVRRVIRKILEECGYKVLLAADVGTALEQLRAHQSAIELVVTDAVMPGGHGVELAEYLTAHQPGTGIMFMSGYLEGAAGGGQTLPPGTRLLAKPFTPAQLASAVREVLDARATPPPPPT